MFTNLVNLKEKVCKNLANPARGLAKAVTRTNWGLN